MTDRISHTVRVSAAPAGRILVLPLARSQWTGLLENGHGLLNGGDHAILRGLSELTRFKAQRGTQLSAPISDGRLVIVVGLGDETRSVALREAAASAHGFLPEGGGVEWSLVVPAADREGSSAADLILAAAEGLLLGPYRFTASTKNGVEHPGPCNLVTDRPEAGAALAQAVAHAEGMVLTRDLVNTPAADLGPGEISAAACEVAHCYGMRTTVYTGGELLEQGFNLTHHVGKAADRPSTVTIVENGPVGATPLLGIIGKGVAFDTGGLDLKTGGSMQLMRKDMGGAGTVIGALETIGRLGCELPFVAILPSAENAIGPGAMRPGDVLRAADGTSVEIGNTDAEGRLLLADGLIAARKLGAPRLLDVATLTGAARVALGPDVPALFGTDEALVADLLERSRRHDEDLWRMPLVDAYEAWIDTPFADVNNSGSDRRGGAITAALFLKRFAKDTPWAHIDLYAWEDRGKPGTPRGGNGMAVRTVAQMVLGLDRL
ncbi:leucyl aminopeptidase family protein [Engelhardtia mirabilis]|uniref:Cytosol aminopeptidase n=1 Tax=Engelhardtia mirabilis TaxID=2528011 RepID=A0A518BF29_9BACT|nr:Cytosol aminopeptidase [Planctomycetes bacterium Pla133]QDU99909.1 Cytosol aminopeptidase [Planctomycetes bacterium Pla86]